LRCTGTRRQHGRWVSQHISAGCDRPAKRRSDAVPGARFGPCSPSPTPDVPNLLTGGSNLGVTGPTNTSVDDGSRCRVDEGCDNEVPDELQDSDEPVFRLLFHCLIGTLVTHGITPYAKGSTCPSSHDQRFFDQFGAAGADLVSQHPQTVYWHAVIGGTGLCGISLVRTWRVTLTGHPWSRHKCF
jgi:hypothetical protein